MWSGRGTPGARGLEGRKEASYLVEGEPATKETLQEGRSGLLTIPRLSHAKRASFFSPTEWHCKKDFLLP